MRYLLLGILCSWIGQGWAIDVIIYEVSPAYCGSPTAELGAQVNGGIPPFTYAWSTGATTWNAYAPPGMHTVTVTDALQEQATAQFTVNVTPLPQINWSFWEGHCPSVNMPMDQGGYLFIRTGEPQDPTPPLTLDGPFSSASYQNTQAPFEEVAHIFPTNGIWTTGFLEPILITGTDANGCPFEVYTTRYPHPEWLAVSVMNVNGACSGGSNGSITLTNTTTSWWRYIEELVFNGAVIDSHQLGALEGAQTRTYEGLAAGTYTLVQRPDWEYQGNGWLESQFIDPDCWISMEIVVPDLGYTCGTINGKVFIDSDHNCQATNGWEPGIAFTVVEAQPGDHYALTDAQGNYAINLPYGSYTLSDQSTLYQEHCGVEGAPFEVNAGTPFVTVNFADTSLTGMDVKLTMSSWAARPGFQLLYSFTATNLTGVLSGPLTVTMDFDPAISFVNASPAPASVTGNTITWNIAQTLGAFQTSGALVRFQVPPDVGLLGTDLISTATVTTGNPDVELANNSVVHAVTVTGSYDPNDKLATTDHGQSDTQFILNEDEWIDYSIRFQNTGTDTAFNVVITDTLSTLLDMATFQQGTASHPFTVHFKTGRVVEWRFINIQLPDSNVNEAASHGLVNFRIKPQLPLLPGDQIENIANIYFDFNEPVITEPSVLVAAVNTGLSDRSFDEGIKLFPQPTSGLVQIDRPIDGLRSVDVIALDGRIIRTMISTAGQTVFDLAFLNNGRYLLRFNTGESHSIHKPVQIMR